MLAVDNTSYELLLIKIKKTIKKQNTDCIAKIKLEVRAKNQQVVKTLELKNTIAL